jgi:hypothetical protein
MSRHFMIHPFGCLRILACVFVLSLAVGVCAPPLAWSQDAPADDATETEALPEDAAEDTTEGAAEEDASPAETEPAPAPEAATPPEPAPADAAPAENKPWTLSEPCLNPQHPYEADLCQQWRTAEAAEKEAAASERTLGLTRLLMLLGALATLLLLLAFIPLTMGALASRRASRAGTPAYAAPTDREDELRAYVDVDKIEFIETPESEGIVKVKITFRNSGQTPAFKVKSAAQVGIRDVSDEDLLSVMPLPNRAQNAARPRLGRDATDVTIVECDSTASLADRVMNGDATILVWGFAEYEDVFDRRRKTAFQYLCNAGTLESGQIFKPMVRGDEDG